MKMADTGCERVQQWLVMGEKLNLRGEKLNLLNVIFRKIGKKEKGNRKVPE